MGKFKEAFSQTIKSETDEIKVKAGHKAAKLLTSWKAWVWLVAIIGAVILFVTGSAGSAIALLVVALLITCFGSIIKTFI